VLYKTLIGVAVVMTESPAWVLLWIIDGVSIILASHQAWVLSRGIEVSAVMIIRREVLLRRIDERGGYYAISISM